MRGLGLSKDTVENGYAIDCGVYVPTAGKAVGNSPVAKGALANTIGSLAATNGISHRSDLIPQGTTPGA